MVNIHEALQKAKQEQRRLWQAPGTDIGASPAARSAWESPRVEPLQPAQRVGTVAPMDAHVVTYYDPTSLVAEQFRSLRTALCKLAGEAPRVVLITSPGRGEGKTTITANLGVAMAALPEQEVLLLDGNLRRPRLAGMLGVAGQPGLTEILSGRIGGSFQDLRRDAIRATAMDRLNVLPAGGATQYPTELLGSRAMGELLERLQEKYTKILIDSPPMVAVTDTSLLGSVVDGVVLVIQAGRTRREVVEHAVSLLHTARVRLLGCVINGVEYQIPSWIYRHL